MGVNLTEVFLLDASTADNPSEKRAGEWKDVTDKAIKPVQRSVMSTLRKSGQPTGRPPDTRRKTKVTFSPGLAPGRDETRDRPRAFRRTQRGKVSITAPEWTKPNLEPRYVLDICSGFQSLAKYYLRAFPRCKVISIDILKRKEALATLTKEEQKRVSYHKKDVSGLTRDVLDEVLFKSWGIRVRDLTHLHWSPMCSTMTSADLGANGYRQADGSAVPGTLAEEHDAIFNRVMTTVRGIA